jgi:hypothetical protein
MENCAKYCTPHRTPRHHAATHTSTYPVQTRTSFSTTLSVILNASEEIFAFSAAQIAMSALARSSPRVERAAQ